MQSSSTLWNLLVQVASFFAYVIFAKIERKKKIKKKSNLDKRFNNLISSYMIHNDLFLKWVLSHNDQLIVLWCWWILNSVSYLDPGMKNEDFVPMQEEKSSPMAFSPRN
jgi:hypothetical protein